MTPSRRATGAGLSGRPLAQFAMITDPDAAQAVIRMMKECEPRAAAARALESE